MDGSDTSSALTSSGSGDFDEHNMCNPMWGLFCHVHRGVFMEAHFDEVDLGRIALSCHLALVLCRDCDHPGGAWNTSPWRNYHQ